MESTKNDANRDEEGDEALKQIMDIKTDNSATNAKIDETMEDASYNAASDDENINAKPVIHDDDLCVQLLARIDAKEYQKAISQDAKSINDNFVLPLHFPWHTTQHLPKRFLKTLPRDIDDLHVITHCEEDLQAPFGDFAGSFGFGRYENGQARGHYNDPLTPKSFQNTIAAARRSEDPGVIELNVQIPLPSSIDAVMLMKDKSGVNLAPAEIWKAEMSKDNIETFSHLPFHWAKKEGSQSFAPLNSNEVKGSAPLRNGIYKSHNDADSDVEFQKLTESYQRTKKQRELAVSCMRRWKVSVKVEGVSSRSSVFPSSSEVDTDLIPSPDKTKRNVIRPMLTPALLPHTVQTGLTVSTETALGMDNEGLAFSLGSYDCRFTEKILTPKKDSSNRSKRTEVGRTRLVWSSLIQGDEPFLPSTRNRINFNSLITGQRVDASKCRRPREVRVGVRLNGKLIKENAIEDLPVIDNKARKRKHSTRQAENDIVEMKPSTQYPSSRTSKEIDAAFGSNIPQAENGEGEKKENLRASEKAAVIYFDVGTQPPSLPEVNRNDIISSLLKFNQKKANLKKIKRSTSNDSRLPNTIGSTETSPVVTGVSRARKCFSPRFACFPLEDGLLRTVCIASGNMARTAINQVLREVARERSDRKCTVCWSTEGFGQEGVQECFHCGLLVHSACCLDKGEFVSIPGALSISSQSQNANRNGGVSNLEPASNHHDQHWRCAVCSYLTDSSSVTVMAGVHVPKMPNSDAPSELAGSKKYPAFHNTKNESAKYATGPACVFCPHSGGAMSSVKLSAGSASHHPQWAHEVCRVWSGANLSDLSKCMDNPSYFHQRSITPSLSTLCALCGLGGMKCSKADCPQSHDGHKLQCNAGLTRCAARGCFVTFHPMCALLASKLNRSQNHEPTSLKTRPTRKSQGAEKKTDNSVKIEDDKKRCKDYTLQLVQLKRSAAVDESIEEHEKATVLPLAFCGLHNPEREDSFYGCLPGGEVLS